MKKNSKRALLLCALLALLCLAACTGMGAEGFVVMFVNDCEAEVYGFHYEYALAGEMQGGGGVSNADNSALARGDSFPKDFVPTDFKQNGPLTGFTLTLWVLDAQGQEYLCMPAFACDAAWGSDHTLSVSGSYAQGFALKEK